MRSEVLAAMARHQMIPEGARVVAAVSGGPDSVCLVHLLRELAVEARFTLAGVAHFNHKLRGEESEGDERFVAELARSLGLSFYTHCAESSAEAGNLEQNARRARRRFFAKLVAEGVADRVALGHTRDDQAETVLFRILRGTGTTGLAGILPVTAEGLIRPLLDVRRASVREYLAEHRIPWREDSSNQSARFARNRIRQELLPALERDWNPNLTEALAHLADVSYEEERLAAGELAGITSAFMVEPGAIEFPVGLVTGKPRALVRRILRHAVIRARGSLARIDYRHIEAIVELATASGSGRVRIPGLVVTRSFEWVRLAIPADAAPVAPVWVEGPGVYPWMGGKSMIELELTSALRPRNACDTLRVEFPPEGLELRAWRPGDQYWPEGRSRAWTVKELFQKARVPSWRRASWPILTSKDKILWVKQFGPAQDAGWLVAREVS